MVERVLRAVKLDATFYQEADSDDNLTGEAILVAVIALVISGGLGGLLTRDGSLIAGIIGGAIAGTLGLAIGAGILLLVGRLFKGTAEYKGLIRTLGYAMAPNVLGFIPFVGWIAGLWTFACGVIAVRESHKVSTGAAVVILLIPTVVIGGLIFLALAALFAALLSGLS